MRALYERVWDRLRRDRRSCDEIEREATPILCFGQWKTALVATAGLNPSEDEFRARTMNGGPKRVLPDASQRFLHWGDGVLTAIRWAEAFRRAEGYFTLGNAYRRWFDRYGPFLRSLGTPFEDGLACHTDYVSPFATKCGLSKCRRETKDMLRDFGERVWVEVLIKCPRVEVIFGHGAGWRRVPELLSARHDWAWIKTPFDGKGGRTWAGQAHLLHTEAEPFPKRRFLVYWWKPNRDGSPLCYLSGVEGESLGAIIKKHAQGRGRLK